MDPEPRPSPNATVGFGGDDEDSRFATRDWLENKRVWCGSKLLQDSYEGFFGLTVASAILMVVSAMQTAWDGITLIEEDSRTKRYAVATGIVLTEILNVLLFILPSFHTAMLIHVGMAQTPSEGAGISMATAIKFFLDKEYAWASIYYRSFAVLMVVVQLALAVQIIGMALTTSDNKARVVSIVKVVFVTLGLFFVWQPNFDIFPAIKAIDDGIPKYDQFLSDAAFVLDPANANTFASNTTAIADKMLAGGGQMIKPQADIGKLAAGWELILVWVLTLLISLADQLELLILNKLKKKDATRDGKVVPA